MSFAQESDAIPEGEPSRTRGKRGGPAWSRKQQVIEQINELIDELDEIDANIALQVGTACTLTLHPAPSPSRCDAAMPLLVSQSMASC